MFLSKLFITILQSCLRILFSTALSQFSAYIDRDPAEYGVIRITHTQHKARSEIVINTTNTTL